MIDFYGYQITEWEITCFDDWCKMVITYKGFVFSAEDTDYERCVEELIKQLDTTEIIEYPCIPYGYWLGGGK